MKLIKTVQRVLQESGVLDTQQKVLVAVSGGVDSMVLLYALQYLKTPLLAAHVNYHLRGEDSDLDEKLVVDYCKANQIDLEVLHGDLDAETGVQEKARDLRYNWFEELKQKHDIKNIFTAHHLNDQAETILFNLSRGSGLKGVSAMSDISDGLIRPLLSFSKQEIREFSDAQSIPSRDDASNASNKYARNKIRNTVIPALEDVNHAVVANLVRFGAVAAQADMLIIEKAKEVWDSNSKLTDCGYELALTEWVDKPFAQLLLHYMLSELGVENSYTNHIYELLFSDSGKKVGTAPFVIWKNRSELIFERTEKNIKAEENLELNSAGNYKYENLSISLQEMKAPKDLKTESNFIFLDPELIDQGLIIRPWKNGDVFQPFGMKGRQKVSDLLIQKKLSIPEKGKIRVLESRGRILWVIGVRTSEFIRVSKGNNKLFKLLITT